MRSCRGQQEVCRHDAGERKAGRGKDRILIPELCQETGDGRPHQESQTKSDTNDAECFGPVLRLRHIGDISLRHGQVPGGQPVNDAGQKHKPQDPRETQNEEADAGADLTDEQNRPSSDAV